MLRLRELRTERGISQQTLADKFNLTQQSIYKYEHELAEPDIKTLKDFANYFDVSIDYLVGYTGKSENEKENGGEVAFSAGEVEMIETFRTFRPELRSALQLIVNTLREQNYAENYHE